MKKIVLNFDEITGNITDKNGLWIGCNISLAYEEPSKLSGTGICGEDIAKIVAAALHPMAAERLVSK